MGNPPLLFGPIPPFNNPIPEPQFFQPSQFFIMALTLGSNVTVTTSSNHNYVLGQNVRLIIPYGFGSRQLSGQTGVVINIPAPNQFTLDLSGLNVDPFFDNPIFRTKAQTIAIGDVNTGIISSTGRSLPTTNIPGSFINISPI